MYRPNIEQVSRPRRKRRKMRVRPMLVLLTLMIGVGMVYGFISLGHDGKRENIVTSIISKSESSNMVEVRRLSRNQIPELNMNTVRYRELFNDTNATQLEAAIRNGLKHPELVDDPSKCPDLVEVKNCDYYVVKELFHSKPYLVPEAAVMLQMIGERFQELLHEQYPGKEYRPVVTSVLRSANDVERLRRVNHNATENSCHLYGTTVDISYTRFRLTDETDTVDHNELYLKNLLTQVLYELRYEGLIYVKYERIGCYHLTLRNPEYIGKKSSEIRKYNVTAKPRSNYRHSSPKKTSPKKDENNKSAKTNGNLVEI